MNYLKLRHLQNICDNCGKQLGSLISYQAHITSHSSMAPITSSLIPIAMKAFIKDYCWQLTLLFTPKNSILHAIFVGKIPYINDHIGFI